MSGHLGREGVERVARGELGERCACPRCSERVVKARARQRLLSQLPEPRLSDAAFQRVRGRLFEEAVPLRRTWLPSWRAPALATVAAGLLVALLVARLGDFGATPAFTPRAEPSAHVSPERQTGFLSFVHGEVQSVPGVAVVGAELTSGFELFTGAGHARLTLPRGECALERRSHVTVDRLDADETALTVHSGRLGCAVRALDGASRFHVQAGARRVSVVGTLFSVARFASEVHVEVAEGVVEVSDGPHHRQVLRLTAPAAVVLEDGEPCVQARPRPATLGGTDSTLAALLAPSTERHFFSLKALPEGSEVRLGNLGFAPGPLAGLLPAGRYPVRAFVPGEGFREGVAVLSATSGASQLVLEPLAPPLRDRTGDPSAIAEVQRALQSHAAALRGCYERWLKRDERASGRVVLTLTLSAEGTVTAARADGELMASGAVRCMVKEARGWALPALGASVELELPVELSPRVE